MPHKFICNPFAVGDMLLVERSLVIKGVNDRLVWETEQRSNGQAVLVRRTADITGEPTALQLCGVECDDEQGS